MVHTQQLPCTIDAGLGQVAKIGLIVLQTDQTIEYEFNKLLAVTGVVCYHCRIPNDAVVTAGTLAKMAADLPTAAELLPSQFNFDAIGYACTSGATIIGENTVARAIQNHHPNAGVSNPLTACKAAFKALGLQKIALLTPYTPAVTQALNDELSASGLSVTSIGYFNLEDDLQVGRVSSESIYTAIISMGEDPECDGIFVSCTSLRVAEVIERAEKTLGKAVVSSNQALAWHLLQLASVNQMPQGYGRLFDQTLHSDPTSRPGSTLNAYRKNKK